MKGNNHIPFFFIIGRPRSGTTLLRLLLDAHPSIIVPPECPMILNLYKKYYKKTTWSRSELLNLYKDILKQRYYETWLINADELKNKLLSYEGNHSFNEILQVVYLSYKSVYTKKSIELIGDKNPVYSLYLKKMNSLYPESKFIYISRDYRDNYLSLTKVNFEVPVVPLVVYRWKFTLNQFRRLQKKNPHRFYFLKYEDLAIAPEKEYRKICDFLNVEFDNNVFDFHDKKEELETLYKDSDDLMKIHTSLLNPITTKKINTWKTGMTEKQIKQADLVAGKSADLAGYERAYTKFSIWSRIIVLPILIYARLMYSAMLIGEKMPLVIRNVLLEVLGLPLKLYWRMNRKKLTVDS